MRNYAVHESNNNVSKSIEYALKSVELSKKLNYMNGLLASYEVTGDAYWASYNYDKSVDYYLLELKLADSLNKKSRKAKANYNIGWIKCVQQGLFSERGKLINSLKVFESLKDTFSIIMVCNALSSVYQNYYSKHHQYLDSANFYFRNMVYLGEKLNNRGGLVTIYGNYAIFLVETKRYPEAKKYILKSLGISETLKDTFGYMNNLNVLASIYYATDSIEKSKKIYNDIIPVLIKKDYRPALMDAYHTLYLIYEKEKNYQKGLHYHLMYKQISDTLNSVIFKSSLQEKESAYEIEKREENIRKLEQINEVSELKNKHNTYIMGGLCLVALLIIGFAVNLFKSNRDKQKANSLLSEQNRVIAEKKHEIEQSIQYAKGIQNAVLPAISDFKRILPQSFVIYLPKDVVSGDFYWMHVNSEINSSEFVIQGSEKEIAPEQRTPHSQLLIAAADCTGHGVPGSLMSIVSVDKLNHAVLGKKLLQPAQILASINNDIKNALKQESAENKQKDGLDIALILLNREKPEITFAGAHRPLWLIREGALTEYKATKTSIAGHTPFNQLFEEQKISLQKNDLILIFSDGYADQFGGEQGKKMMTRNFKNQALEIAHKSIPEIESSLLESFLAWKGRYEQVDDVLVIGFKI